MASTVRIELQDKDRLRRLQLAWRRATGEEPAQHELLAAALRVAEKHVDELVAEGSWRPLTDVEWNSYLHLVAQTKGYEGSADEIDDVVYGNHP